MTRHPAHPAALGCAASRLVVANAILERYLRNVPRILRLHYRRLQVQIKRPVPIVPYDYVSDPYRGRLYSCDSKPICLFVPSKIGALERAQDIS